MQLICAGGVAARPGHQSPVLVPVSADNSPSERNLAFACAICVAMADRSKSLRVRRQYGDNGAGGTVAELARSYDVRRSTIPRLAVKPTALQFG
jgi:hypothetical protein